MLLEDEPGSGAGSRTGGQATRSADGALRRNGQLKNTKHRHAEAKRRERINERLQSLRELVPHDTRSNTATFLEGVISYIHGLQQTNQQLEAELAALTAMRAAAQASLEQQQELLAQPAGSGSNAANSGQQAHSASQHHTHQQQHFLDSSWRQDSVTSAAAAHMQQHSSGAAAAAATAGAVTAAVPMQLDAHTDHRSTLQQLERHQLQLQQQQAERQALSSSPPLQQYMSAAAVAGAAVPVLSTLSAPETLMQAMANPNTTDADAAAAAAAAAAGYAASSRAPAVAAAGGGGGGVLALHPGVERAAAGQLQAAMQPVELQSVLEKALLAAFEQQAQQLAQQLLNKQS